MRTRLGESGCLEPLSAACLSLAILLSFSACPAWLRGLPSFASRHSADKLVVSESVLRQPRGPGQLPRTGQGSPADPQNVHLRAGDCVGRRLPFSGYVHVVVDLVQSEEGLAPEGRSTRCSVGRSAKEASSRIRPCWESPSTLLSVSGHPRRVAVVEDSRESRKHVRQRRARLPNARAAPKSAVSGTLSTGAAPPVPVGLIVASPRTAKPGEYARLTDCTGIRCRSTVVERPTA